MNDEERERYFAFLRAYEGICKEHSMIVGSESDPQIVDFKGKWRTNPDWYLYFEMLDIQIVLNKIIEVG